MYLTDPIQSDTIQIQVLALFSLNKNFFEKNTVQNKTINEAVVVNLVFGILMCILRLPILQCLDIR